MRTDSKAQVSLYDDDDDDDDVDEKNFYKVVIFYNDEVRSEDSPEDYLLVGENLGKTQPEYAIRKIQDNRHQLLVYADDVNMLGENPQTSRENTEILLEASKTIGFEVNAEKTKHMIVSRDQNIIRNGNIKIGDLTFEEVEKFKYLGATVTNINDSREEINAE
ncbi:hypothetical protein ANN_19942 [Periplaneta americana]|uniref:Reverse transcriptase domain-containing protein n=1 Tax=Periplaneta americana TaxID=6978 RepID=A0ABQ8SBX8_PERAM|nr:hypothetical protein ANN_19942 [Periplaneta americana]